MQSPNQRLQENSGTETKPTALSCRQQPHVLVTGHGEDSPNVAEERKSRESPPVFIFSRSVNKPRCNLLYLFPS
ncbi:hypothetical protein Y1Q_0013393 [Alligator mississippiensis]|uniref:Uncharacterized protein n=1 Tax=Alligator mississippiensis TaxID=8496 RepID=A0A151NVC6_ALLMI|nr:hypothetical protein Y1Q_0013393 [Alligator mississippiensis]